jgi:hypothetical protein
MPASYLTHVAQATQPAANLTMPSPELQPAEHLWPVINEPLANQHFHTLADLDEVLAERCCDLANDPDRIKSSTQFHWWPAFI